MVEGGMRMPSVPPDAIEATASCRKADLASRHRDLGHGAAVAIAERSRAEAGAGHDRGHGEAAAAMAEESVRRLIEILGHARAGHEIAHQDEEGQHRELVVEPGRERDLLELTERRLDAAQQGEPGEADDAHGERDRDARE